MKSVYNFYDKYIESPLMKAPTPVRWGALGALNAGSTMAYNAMPWVTEEEKSNPLLSAAMSTPAEVLAMEYTQGLKSKYGTNLADAMEMNQNELSQNLSRKWGEKLNGKNPTGRDTLAMTADVIKEGYVAPFRDIYNRSNPFMQAAVAGSAIAGLSQLPLMGYNLVFPAKVNMDVGTGVAFGLGALAPLSMALVNKARGKA
jgi:hypothetical protein